MCMMFEDAMYAIKRMIKEGDTDSPRFNIALDSLEMRYSMLQRENGIVRERAHYYENEALKLSGQLFEVRKGIDELSNKAGDETAKKFREHVEQKPFSAHESPMALARMLEGHPILKRGSYPIMEREFYTESWSGFATLEPRVANQPTASTALERKREESENRARENNRKYWIR